MDKLGIEPMLLLAQIVNFTIIVIVLTKLLYKPILSMLEKRKREIEQGLQASEKMKEAEAKLLAKQEKLLEQTRKDATILIEQARKDAKEVEKDLIAQAHKDIEELREKAKEEIERQKKIMEKSVESHAVDLAVAMTKRLITAVMSPEDQHKLIAKQLKTLEKEMKL